MFRFWMFRIWLTLFLLVFTLARAQGAQQNGGLDDALFGDGAGNATNENLNTNANSGDDLFGAQNSFVSAAGASTANPAADLLTSETVTLGGDFRLTADLELALNPEEDEDTFTSGLLDLKTRLFLDARPSRDFRTFVKGDVAYSTVNGVSLALREVFADVSVADTVFVRAGKQTVNWGVGRFFSPANLINLETIDPEDPDAELSGPVAIKAQLPLGTDNATGYLLLDDIETGDDIGLAGRYELLLEGYELTVGGLYRSNRPWAVMSTATGAVRGLTVFGEVVLEGDSDKVFVVENGDLPLDTAVSDSLLVSGTLGAQYRVTTEDDLYTVTGSAQYFFNGLGYEDTSVFTDDPAAIGTLLQEGKIGVSDLTARGRHYAAATLSSPDIAKTDLTPNAFWLGNLSDGSGQAEVSLEHSGVKNLIPSVSYSYAYGAVGAEHSPRGKRHMLKMALEVSGSF